MAKTAQKQTVQSKKNYGVGPRGDEPWDSPANLERLVKRSCKTQLDMGADANKIRKWEKKLANPLLKPIAQRRIDGIRAKWQSGS